MIDVIEETALSILDQRPAAVVRHRLLRDVLRRPATSSDRRQAEDGLAQSRSVIELAREQRVDGGWGAFHSRSTQAKQKIVSTEVGVERALSLGLDNAHPILRKASGYILAIMERDLPFPDYQEKNDRWQTGMRLFLASTLSMIDPAHPALDEDRTLWIEIAERAFQSGRYREHDEIEAHAELTGATVKDSYLVLNNRYQLNILGSIPGRLTEILERALLWWLWERSDGIGYLDVSLNPPPPLKSGPLDRWLTSLEMLARLFPRWVHWARPSIDWLWVRRDDSGYWDLGPRPGSMSYFPLSDSWRSRQNRRFDWTTRILVLLRSFYERQQES